MLEIDALDVSIGGHQIACIEHLELAAGERLGLVGESGSGKSMTAMSIVGLHPRDARVTGSIRFHGRELVGLSDNQLAEVRGREIGVVFQDPAKALNPMMRIGKQIGEAMRLHTDLPRAKVGERVVDLLRQVQLPDPEGLVRRYPHQLSGGQQQRVLIAMAIACDPLLLIADEPTTALDVTVQNGILALLRDLSAERGMGLLFISHDLGVVQSISERLAVVYGGNLVETGPTDEVIADPRHRYTEALLSVNPGIAADDGLSAALHQQLGVIPGSVPALGRFPAGCRFRGRCAFETPKCVVPPAVTVVATDRTLKCWNPAGVDTPAPGVLDAAH